MIEMKHINLSFKDKALFVDRQKGYYNVGTGIGTSLLDQIKGIVEVFGDDNKIKLIDPLEVIDFHNFLARSYLILTDSGGIQEEAPSLGKPVLVLRDTTERPEALEAGTVKLVGTSKETIIKEAQKLLDDENEYNTMSKAHNPYGDGKACERIVNFVKESNI